MSEHFIGKDNVEIYDNCEQRYTKSHLNSTNANLALHVNIMAWYLLLFFLQCFAVI